MKTEQYLSYLGHWWSLLNDIVLWEMYANSTYLKNHFPILTIYKGHSCVYV